MAKKLVTLIISGDSKAASDKALQIRQDLLGEYSEWNSSEHDGQSVELDDVLGDLLTPSFTGDTKVVTVKRVDGFSASDLEQLVEALKEIPRGVCFIATAGNVDKRSRFYRGMKKLGQVLELDTAGESALLQWVKTTGEKMGLLNMPEAVAQLLTERSGGSLAWLQEELIKLAAYQTDSQSVLTLEEAEALISGGFSEVDKMAPFQLLDLIAQGAAGKAVELLHQLLESGQPALALFGTIAWQYRMVVAAASLQRAGIPASRVPQRIADTMNMKAFPAQKASQLAVRLGYERSYRAFDLIFTANYQGRLGVHTPEHALELLVIQLAELVNAKV